MSQRVNDHSLLNETNESTFFLSLLFSMQTDCCISRGEKKVNVALHTSHFVTEELGKIRQMLVEEPLPSNISR